MDGLIALIIIGWIVASLKKKPKAAKKAAKNNILDENVVRHREERSARLRAELEKRRMQQAAQTVQPVRTEQIVMGEGDSHGDAGSMMFDSTEGECVCEPELGHEPENVPAPESVYAGEIGREPLVDFSARGIMQGVVMSEILARPAQRARHRR